MTELESCPKCGALPCDWVDNPHLPSGERGRVSAAMADLVEFIRFRREHVARVPSINQMTEWHDLLSDMRETLSAFVGIRDQFPQSMKLIQPTMDGFTPITITITKAQFIAAELLVSGPSEPKDSSHGY